MVQGDLKSAQANPVSFSFRPQLCWLQTSSPTLRSQFNLEPLSSPTRAHMIHAE
ncbi:advanced glycosylation end product-specific receptor, isoform CRA_c [Rattus norvegicus]|uniref:Advanced glycosylation end product-specific receptor, isoform CRA_c n=1 Tax=Rattus norvegicus TaxID=10116 RepID=A6KTG4_RAT|nr:advanced glycosylation end product-specific receptor, isoform CRA_c [Rattus norvegicus]